MLNLSRIQVELERAKEKLRNVEETIQKVEGKTFSNGPVRYSGLKVEFHSEKQRNPMIIEDVKNQRRRVISSAIDSRNQRVSSDDVTLSLKRNLKEKRDSGVVLKHHGGDARPQGVFARLSGISFQQTEEEEEEDFPKKPSLPSRVFTTASEAPSRQEVIAAQAIDEQSKQRNKRMFGALVGTLQKFRKEETRVREREEKRLKVEKKLEEDAKREKEKLMQEKRELFLEKKRREVEIKRIEWSLNRVKEYEAWEANVLPLKNFIQTQAKPHIFYLPGTHNNKTDERLAYSQKLVERMIEKRKTNLKEEIENSEKKARRSAVEGVEEEEAENIPEDNEEPHNTEQQMDVHFEAGNKENGYHEEDKKMDAENSKDLTEPMDAGKLKEDWNKVKESEANADVGEIFEKESEHGVSSVNKTKEKSPIVETKDSNKPICSTNEEKPDDDDDGPGEGQAKNDDDFGKISDGNGERISESEESKNISVDVNVDDDDDDDKEKEEMREYSEANASLEAPLEKSQDVEKEAADQKQRETESLYVKSNDKIVDDSEVQSSKIKESVSESVLKGEDNAGKNSEVQKRKSKAGEASRRRERSRSRKAVRRSRSRSPRRMSRSPRRPSRSDRRRSGSRRKGAFRKRTRSDSSPKKSRRSRSPTSKRKLGTSSKRRSPRAKSRRRKSSSGSSLSMSPRKRRSKSSSTSSSKSY